MPRWTKPREDRFWEKVDVRGPNECWLWTAGVFKATGYGMFHWEAGGSPMTANRASLILDGRDPGQGGDSRHLCDNRLCVNPRHLAPGSRKQNVADAREKGRLRGGSSGEQNGMSKVTPDDVREIRERCASGEVQVQIAKDFGITPTTVSQIKKRQTWRHVR